MPSWYHVCAGCDAKWFQSDAIAPCPRCCRRSESREQITPPWQVNAGAVPPGESNSMTNHNATTAGEGAASAEPAASDEVLQQQLRQAYREQLRRMACPGCGEGEPEF